MADYSFDYRDYHRTIIGFHGTTLDAADQFVNGQPFTASDQDEEWFGRGVYFWEYAPKQAWWWAKDYKHHPRPAVVGAAIRLGNCFDLLDSGNVDKLRQVKIDMEAGLTTFGEPIPKNVRSR